MEPPLCPPSASAPAAAVNTVKKMLCAVQRGMWFCKQDFKPLPVCVHLFPVGRGGSRDNQGCQLVGLALEKGETSGEQVQQHMEEHPLSSLPPGAWTVWGGRGGRVHPFLHLLRGVDHSLSPCWDGWPCSEGRCSGATSPGHCPCQKQGPGLWVCSLCQSELWMRFGHGWDDGFPRDSRPGVSHPWVVPLWG